MNLVRNWVYVSYFVTVKIMQILIDELNLFTIYNKGKLDVRQKEVLYYYQHIKIAASPEQLRNNGAWN